MRRQRRPSIRSVDVGDHQPTARPGCAGGEPTHEGQIVNPPLDDSGAGGSAAEALQNPPLGSGAGGSAAEALQNPPLGSGAGGSAAEALQNPPLDDGGGSERTGGASVDNPPLSSVSNAVDADGLNPSLDEADIERRFEEQLGKGSPPVPLAEKPVAKRRAAKKASTRKRASKSVAEKRATTRKPAKKQASRRHSSSKDSRTE